MKVLKKIGIGLLSLILLLVLISFFLPGQIHVERSLEMKATPQAAFNLVNDLKAWEEWSPWHKLDPAIKLEYSEHTVGLNASYSWKSDNSNVGNGKITIIESNQSDHIKTQLDFEGMSSSYAHYYFKPTPDGVIVTWTMEADMGMNPVGKFFGLMMDRMIGPDFEKGLASMKEIAEKTPVKETIAGFDFEERTIGPMMVMGIREKKKHAEISSSLFGEWFGAISMSASKQKAEFAGPAMSIYYSYDQIETDMEAAIPVTARLKDEGRVKCHEVPATKALVVSYYGAYGNVAPVYDAAFAYLKSHGIKNTGAPMEIYVTDPASEKDTAKWLTEVVFPIE